MANSYGATAEPNAELGADQALLATESAAVTPTMVSASSSRKIVVTVTLAAAISGLAAVLSRPGHLMSSTQQGLRAQDGGDIDDGYFDNYTVDDYNDDYYKVFGDTSANVTTNSTEGLTCNYFDDDSVYPNNGCNFGDSGVCVEAVQQSAKYYDTCSMACDQGSMDLYNTGSTDINKYNNASWAVVCGWEAVKNLPSLCNGTFTPNLGETAAQAQNVDPRAYDTTTRLHTQNVSGNTYHGCNLHAFCLSCEMTDEETGEQTYNKYCQAMTDYYGEGALYELKTFFNHLNRFWCTNDVLWSIDDGSFNDKYHKWTDGGIAFGSSSHTHAGSAEDDDVLFGADNAEAEDDDPFAWEQPPRTGEGAVGGGEGDGGDMADMPHTSK